MEVIEEIKYLDELPSFGPNAIVAFDFETLQDSFKPDMVSFYWSGGHGVIDFKKNNNDYDLLFRIMDAAPYLLAHNISFELSVLDAVGYRTDTLYGRIYDTMPMLHVLNTESELGLKAQGGKIGMDMSLEWSDASKLSREEYTRYCLKDSLACHMLMSTLYPRLKSEGVLIPYLMEIDLIWVFRKMYANGIKVDKEMLLSLQEKVSGELMLLKKDLIEIAGKVINFKSTKQLVDVIFTDLGGVLKHSYKTEKGNVSVKENVVSDILRSNPNERLKIFCEKLLQFKEKTKFLDAFLSDKYFSLIHPDGRMRPKFWSLGTKTSRLSSAHPNIQQLPSQGDGALIRKAFVAPAGYTLICADLSQAEYRFLAHFSGDEDLINAYKNGIDIHTLVSKEIGIERRMAKIVNFALLYGMGPEALASKLGISFQEARNYISKYFARFPGIQNYLTQAVAYGKANKGIRLMSGRLRKLNKYDFIDNMCKNTPIQGAVAEYMKLCMISLHRMFLGTPVKMLIQVHDELLIECPENMLDETMSAVKKVMESVHLLSVPMVAEAKAAKSWGEAK